MDFLKTNKEKLCRLLANHFEKVMEYAEDLITGKEYKAMNKQEGKKGIGSLLEVILQKEEKTCQEFASFLCENYPQVKELSKNESHQVYADQGSTVVASETANTTMKSYKMEVNVDGHQGGNYGPSPVCLPSALPGSGSRMVATNNSQIFAPVLKNSNITEDVCFTFNVSSGSRSAGASNSQISGANLRKRRSHPIISDKSDFFQRNRTALIQNVKNVKPVLDELIQRDFHQEMAASIHAEKIPQNQMRGILDSVTSKGLAEVLFQALLTHEGPLMAELTESYEN